jgi:DNA polymerase V
MPVHAACVNESGDVLDLFPFRVDVLRRREKEAGCDMGYDGTSTTGFQSPARDAADGPLDLARILDVSAPGTYAVRVAGTEMETRAIREGDVLLVDTTLPPRQGCVAVAHVGGRIVVAEMDIRKGEWWLVPGGRPSGAVRVSEGEADVWGVVRGLVRTRV